MRKKNMLKRPVAALLALVLALTMAPVAMAETLMCPDHPTQAWTETIIKKPNCHEEGVAEYSCPVTGCKYKGQLRKLNMDPTNHEGVYTDNGNGTHSGVCNYTLSHAAGVRIDGEKHTYDATGKCEKCGAYNYDKVILNLPNRTIPVALNDADAKLTIGDIKLVLGSADITKDYDLSYAWYDQQDNPVSISAECPLPASVYGKEGTYYYTLLVRAIPKGSTTRQPVSESCTITVEVDELVTASAIITTEYPTLRMDELDNWSADSISSQIYEAAKAFCGRNADPYYVTFNTATKTGTAAGDLEISSTPYYFDRIGSCLDDVIFRTTGAAGNYTIAFTVTDTASKSYAGMLTITVQQYVGNMDVVYIASRNEAFSLNSEDFVDFWAKVNPRGVLDYITFDELPRSVDGSLYAGYTSQVLTGDRVRTSDLFYVEPGRNEYGIDEVTFLPSVAQNGYITLGFTAYGTWGSGYTSHRHRSGTIYIFFTNSIQSADVSLTVTAAGTSLDPAAFQKAYQNATGGAGASFYIQLLDVPASGALYTGRTATKQGVRLTETSIEGRPFAYNGSLSETISSLSYVPGAAAVESIRYVASSAQGKPLYAGKITFTTSGAGTGTSIVSNNRISYKCDASGVKLQASDFENLPGENDPKLKLNMVKFTLPSAAYGTLYLNRSAVSVGTPLTNKDEWYSVSSTAVANSVNNITFVPAAGYVGLVTINFEALNNSGDRASGSVQITVSSSTTTTTNPGTMNPGTTTVRPAKTFPDVPAYYQPYISDLTSKGVINGYEDGTFRPDEAVKLGEVLKLIMLSVGYPEQAPTGKHWASGYLTKALADSLLPANLLNIISKLKNNEDILDRIVSRYEIAVITANAMKLPITVVTSSPFSDMAVSETAAPHVMALYNIGVLIGTGDANSNPYQGTMAIRRRDIAVIVWRVRNYVETGNVNGITAAN